MSNLHETFWTLLFGEDAVVVPLPHGEAVRDEEHAVEKEGVRIVPIAYPPILSADLEYLALGRALQQPALVLEEQPQL